MAHDRTPYLQERFFHGKIEGDETRREKNINPRSPLLPFAGGFLLSLLPPSTCAISVCFVTLSVTRLVWLDGGQGYEWPGKSLLERKFRDNFFQAL